MTTRRRVAWLIVATSSVYLIGWAAFKFQGDEMGRKELQAKAVKEIRAGNYPAALATCAELQELIGGPVLSHALRGKVFEDQKRFHESYIEYTAAYNLGDHIAGGSAARMSRLMAGGK